MLRNHVESLQRTNEGLLSEKIERIVRDSKQVEQDLIARQVDIRLQQLRQEAERSAEFGYTPPPKRPKAEPR